MEPLRAPARDPKEIQILSEHPVLRKTLPPDRSSNASRWRTDDLELKPDPSLAKRKRRGSNRSFTSMNSAENDRPPLHSWNKPLSETNQNVVTSPLEWNDLKEEKEAKDWKKTDHQSAFQTDSGWPNRNLEEAKLSVLWEASDEKAGQEDSNRTEHNAPIGETNTRCSSNVREVSSTLSNSWVAPVDVPKQQVTPIQPPADDNSLGNTSGNKPSGPSTNVATDSFVNELNNAKPPTNSWENPSVDESSKPSTDVDVNSWGGPFVKEPSNSSLSTSTDETSKSNPMDAINASNNPKTLMGRDAFRNKPKIHRNTGQDASYDTPPSLATVGRITEGDGWGNPSGDPAGAHGGWENCYPDDEERKNRSRTHTNGSKGGPSQSKFSGTQGSPIDLLQPSSVLFKPLPVEVASSSCQKKTPPYNQNMDHSQLTAASEKVIPHQETTSNQVNVDHGVNSIQFPKNQVHETQAYGAQDDSTIDFTDYLKDVRVLICQPKVEVAKGVYQRVPIYMDSSIIQIVEDLNNERKMEMGSIFKARLCMALMKEAVLSYCKVNRFQLP
ncbi:hypothetical protein G6F56_009103 [Rhizopus delemar]|nr:hypothetical protein G6F56_009103 [Rhizopus delemar]